MTTKNKSRFVLVRSNKAVAAHHTPKIGVLAFLLLLSATSCHRQPAAPQNGQSTPSPTPSAGSFPQRIGLVNDFADTFDSSEEKNLESVLTQLKTDADVEFVVVTIDSANGQSLFDYSLALANEWAPGGNNGRGLVLVLALKDREWRLQVSKALEKQLPDNVCLSLAEPAEELYRQGKFAEGVEAYVKAIGDRLRKR